MAEVFKVYLITELRDYDQEQYITAALNYDPKKPISTASNRQYVSFECGDSGATVAGELRKLADWIESTSGE